MASTSFGLMMMPSTPWTIAVSTSAVCLGVLPWPSLSIDGDVAERLGLGLAAPSCMWTKNGNAMFGNEVRMVSGLSAWATAGPARPEMARAAQPAATATVERRVIMSKPP